ncbi:MAG TPA: integrase core domain-containing protein [Armatimonadota bacterium]|nr:integrase core domain-containing protein [Armatimonadota bacterium]
MATRFGVSPATVHRWKHRDDPVDRSCEPERKRYALLPQEERLVLFMRGLGLSIDDILDALESVLPGLGRSNLYRLLVRRGMNRLPRRERENGGRFGEYAPGYLHIDFFFLPRVDARKRYCFVAVDRATRLVYLRVYERQTKHVTADFLARCLRFYPFRIRTVLTDNSRSFTHACFKNARGSRVLTIHPFEELCRREVIDYRRIKPRTPRTNGLVERVIGLIRADTTNRNRYPGARQMVEALQSWFIYYNFYRKHRRIGRITPYAKVCQYYQAQPNLFIKEPTHLLNYCSQCGET